MPKPALPIEEKLRKQHTVDPSTGCWHWTGTLTNSGYGQVCVARSKHAYAHRESYRIFVEEIPEGLLVCHRCDNPRCINPEHLFLGTYKDNADDMVSKDRQVRGERSYAAKLNEKQVRLIRADSRKYRDIAAEYGVTSGLIGHIKHRRAWRSVQ